MEIAGYIIADMKKGTLISVCLFLALSTKKKFCPFRKKQEDITKY